jgi:hypothetical protein
LVRETVWALLVVPTTWLENCRVAGGAGWDETAVRTGSVGLSVGFSDFFFRSSAFFLASS